MYVVDCLPSAYCSHPTCVCVCCCDGNGTSPQVRALAFSKLVQFSPGDVLHCSGWQDVLQLVVGTLAEAVPTTRDRGMDFVYRLFVEATAVSCVQAAEIHVAVATQCLNLHDELAAFAGPLTTL